MKNLNLIKFPNIKKWGSVDINSILKKKLYFPLYRYIKAVTDKTT